MGGSEALVAAVKDFVMVAVVTDDVKRAGVPSENDAPLIAHDFESLLVGGCRAERVEEERRNCAAIVADLRAGVIRDVGARQISASIDAAEDVFCLSPGIVPERSCA